MAGSDPRSPQGLWRGTRVQSGVAPGPKTFFPAFAWLVTFTGLFLCFQGLVLYLKWNYRWNPEWNEHFRVRFRLCSGFC